MKNLAVARRYAKALLMIGKENGQSEVYREDLDRVSILVSGKNELEQAIRNPLYDAVSRKNILQVVLNNLSLSKEVQSFLLLLFDKGRIGLLSNINEFYQKLADELRGVVRANLITAVELPEPAIKKIRSALSKMTGKDIKLEVEQDSSLIGGVVASIGDLVLDGSIKTQLLNMRESLKRGESVEWN